MLLRLKPKPTDPPPHPLSPYPISLLTLSLLSLYLLFNSCIWLVNHLPATPPSPQVEAERSVGLLIQPSCSFGRERRQLCLQAGSWRTFSRIYYSYRSVSERDLQPPVSLTSSPPHSLLWRVSVSEQITLFLMNWVFMSVAVVSGHPRYTEPGTIRGLGEIFLVNGQMFGRMAVRERHSLWFLPRAHVFCQADFCPLSAAVLLPVRNDVLTPVSFYFPVLQFYCYLPLVSKCWPWSEI